MKKEIMSSLLLLLQAHILKPSIESFGFTYVDFG